MKLNYKNILSIRKLANDPKRLFVFLIVLAFFFILNSCSTHEANLQGKVIRVVDGDTIELLDQNKKRHKIRFFGIDAPESNQAYGLKSKQFLASLVAGKEVKIHTKEKDKYGRILGIVYLDDKDINKIMVENGFAWAYTYYSDKYKLEHDQAKKDKNGLWADKNPIEPYKWRKMEKK